MRRRSTRSSRTRPSWPSSATWPATRPCSAAANPSRAVPAAAQAMSSCVPRISPRARSSIGRAAASRRACTSRKRPWPSRLRATTIPRPMSCGRWHRASAPRATHGRRCATSPPSPSSNRPSPRCGPKSRPTPRRLWASCSCGPDRVCLPIIVTATGGRLRSRAIRSSTPPSATPTTTASPPRAAATLPVRAISACPTCAAASWRASIPTATRTTTPAARRAARRSTR